MASGVEHDEEDVFERWSKLLTRSNFSEVTLAGFVVQGTNLVDNALRAVLEERGLVSRDASFEERIAAAVKQRLVDSLQLTDARQLRNQIAHHVYLPGTEETLQAVRALCRTHVILAGGASVEADHWLVEREKRIRRVCVPPSQGRSVFFHEGDKVAAAAARSEHEDDRGISLVFGSNYVNFALFALARHELEDIVEFKELKVPQKIQFAVEHGWTPSDWADDDLNAAISARNKYAHFGKAPPRADNAMFCAALFLLAKVLRDEAKRRGIEERWLEAEALRGLAKPVAARRPVPLPLPIPQAAYRPPSEAERLDAMLRRLLRSRDDELRKIEGPSIADAAWAPAIGLALSVGYALVFTVLAIAVALVQWVLSIFGVGELISGATADTLLLGGCYVVGLAPAGLWFLRLFAYLGKISVAQAKFSREVARVDGTVDTEARAVLWEFRGKHVRRGVSKGANEAIAGVVLAAVTALIALNAPGWIRGLFSGRSKPAMAAAATYVPPPSPPPQPGPRVPTSTSTEPFGALARARSDRTLVETMQDAMIAGPAPEPGERKTLSYKLCQQGYEAYEKGEFAKAEKLLMRALNNGPLPWTRAEIHRRLALILVSAGDRNAAYYLFYTSIKMRADGPDTDRARRECFELNNRECVVFYHGAPIDKLRDFERRHPQ